jgi:hypothetical protein
MQIDQTPQNRSPPHAKIFPLMFSYTVLELPGVLEEEVHQITRFTPYSARG